MYWSNDSSLRPKAEMGDVQEAIHLNKLLRLYPPGVEGGVRWELETDPRSVEILISQMGLGDAKQSSHHPWCTDD